MPSTVFTRRSAHASPNTRHDNTGRPSTKTVQVPHSPSSQPCLVPVRPRSSRSTSSSVLWAAKLTSHGSPFRSKRMRGSLSAGACGVHPKALSGHRAPAFFSPPHRPERPQTPPPRALAVTERRETRIRDEARHIAHTAHALETRSLAPHVPD